MGAKGMERIADVDVGALFPPNRNRIKAEFVHSP